jgi:hypothetical protein
MVEVDQYVSLPLVTYFLFTGSIHQEVLPLLLAPSPALGAYVNHALSTLQTSAGPSSQLRALVYAVRWGTGIQGLEDLEGDRWLATAAGYVRLPFTSDAFVMH